MAQERHNWLVDGSHTGNIHGSIRVRSGGMAARAATEVRLIRPVTFIAMTAHRAGATGVARLDVDHAHARKLRLVADKRSQLAKSPGMARPALRASNRDSRPN